jgi:hypothetical protein
MYDQGELFLTCGDIDLDGDEDALGVNLNKGASLYLFTNHSSPNDKPFFLVPELSPIGLPTAGPEDRLLFPTLVDIDGDIDLDLFILRSLPNNIYQLEYYVNDLSNPVRDPARQDMVTLQPQPAQDLLILENHTHEYIEDIQLFDITGQLLSWQYGRASHLDVSALPAGIYLIEIHFASQIFRKLFIKQTINGS